ncbi:glycosyltransferase family 4 protein [Vibrio sp. TRT 21S02]|uniref:glycosyltransferase family 4 protein n=1 Tax=Vibrio sp. TRT 21S02 TaxID=3418507 RepID=UPI003CF7C9A9
MKAIQPNEIWLLIDSLTMGGIESHVYEISLGLKQFNHPVRVIFIARYEKPAPLEEKLDRGGIPYLYLNQEFTGLPPLLSLLKAVEKYQPSLIHSHGYKASLLSKLIHLKTHTPQISTFHAGETPKGRVWLYDLIDRSTAFISNEVIAVSSQIQSKLPCHSLRLNNFVSNPNPTLTHGLQIAFVGRLSHEKAPDRFIDIAKASPTHKFHCYGEGPMEASLHVRKPSNLEFHGHQSDMAQVWPNISVLIICSRFEGLPMAALEAMSRGIIVMATSVGDLPALLENRINGYLVEHWRELGNAIEHWFMLSDSSKKMMRIRALHTWQKNYTVDAVIPQLTHIYRKHASAGFLANTLSDSQNEN